MRLSGQRDKGSFVTAGQAAPAGTTGVRYLLVAGLCMAAHIAIMIVSDAAAIPLAPALLLSFATIVLLGYALHTRFSFAVARAPGGLVRYTGAMAAAFPIAAAFLWLYSRAFGWPMWIAAPAGSLTMLLVNFLLARWALVRKARG